MGGRQTEKEEANCDIDDSKWGGKMTAPVGSFPKNGWGIFDLTGNVSEWVGNIVIDDNASEVPELYPTAGDDGEGGQVGLIRGASFTDNRTECNWVFRIGPWKATVHDIWLGFRVSRGRTDVRIEGK